MRVSFFFSVSASNRVIHMSNCSLPLCFRVSNPYGMTRKVKEIGEICSEKNYGEEGVKQEWHQLPQNPGVEALLIGPQAPNKVS